MTDTQITEAIKFYELAWVFRLPTRSATARWLVDMVVGAFPQLEGKLHAIAK